MTGGGSCRAGADLAGVGEVWQKLFEDFLFHRTHPSSPTQTPPCSCTSFHKDSFTGTKKNLKTQKSPYCAFSASVAEGPSITRVYRKESFFPPSTEKGAQLTVPPAGPRHRSFLHPPSSLYPSAAVVHSRSMRAVPSRTPGVFSRSSGSCV